MTSSGLREPNLGIVKLQYDEANQTPWILPRALAPGVWEKNAVDINKRDEELLTFIADVNATVSSLLNKLVALIFKTGISFKIVSGLAGDHYLLNMENPVVKNWHDLEIVPALEKIFYEFLLYGFCSVVFAPSQYAEHLQTIVVLPRKYVKQTMTFDRWMRPTFEVYTYNATTKFGGYNAPIPNSQVLIYTAPTVEGRLDSPIKRASKIIGYAETMLFYYMSGFHRNVFTPYVWSSEDKGSARQAVAGPENTVDSASTVTQVTGLGYVSLEQAEANAEEKNRHYTRQLELENQKRRKEARMMRGFEHLPGDDKTELNVLMPPEIRRIESFDPVDDEYVAMPGRTLQKPPEVRSPGDLMEHITNAKEEIYTVLELHPAMNQAISDNAASIDAIDRSTRDTVLRHQTKLRPIFEMIIADLAGFNISERVYKSEVFPDKELRKNSDGMKKKLSQVRVQFQFNHVPSMTFQAVTEYYEAGIITPEAYQDISLQIGGIPRTAKRPNMEKWRDAQWKKQNPPKNPGEVPKKPKKPKKKSSSNKKQKT
jgi:hypothetical protein